MGTYIKGISYYLPEKVYTNEEISTQHPEWSIEKISSKTGIKARHIAAEDEYASDMAISASLKLFEEYSIQPDEIEFVLYCTQSPDYFLPTTACILQDRLGIQITAGALDYNLGCSGYIYGLSLAKGLIESKQVNNVLLITSETYSKYIHPNDKSNKTIFGDAASATLIGSDKGIFEIKNFSFGTNGKGAENLIVKNGGVRNRFQLGKDITDAEGNYISNDSCLYMNGSEIFSFTSQAVPVLVNDVIQRNHLSFEEVDYFLFHQANKYMLDFIRRKINIPQEKFVYYIENVGNTVSSTIPIALKEAVNQDMNYKKGLLAGFGVGYSWAGCIIERVG